MRPYLSFISKEKDRLRKKKNQHAAKSDESFYSYAVFLLSKSYIIIYEFVMTKVKRRRAMNKKPSIMAL